MENTQPTKTGNGSGSKAATSGASIRSYIVAVTEKNGSTNSPQNTTATMQNASPKTWTSAELAELQLKAGLVAGALADFQTAGGIVAVKNIEYKTPSGSTFSATKLYLVVEGASLSVQKTADGLDFKVAALAPENKP